MSQEQILDLPNKATRVVVVTTLAFEDLVNQVGKFEKRGSGNNQLNFPINTAATTLAKDAPGHINNLRAAGGTLGAVTIYDGPVAGGLVLLPTVTPVQGQILLEDVDFNTGLTIVTAAATVIVGSIR